MAHIRLRRDDVIKLLQGREQVIACSHIEGILQGEADIEFVDDVYDSGSCVPPVVHWLSCDNQECQLDGAAKELAMRAGHAYLRQSVADALTRIDGENAIVSGE